MNQIGMSLDWAASELKRRFPNSRTDVEIANFATGEPMFTVSIKDDCGEWHYYCEYELSKAFNRLVEDATTFPTPDQAKDKRISELEAELAQLKAQ